MEAKIDNSEVTNNVFKNIPALEIKLKYNLPDLFYDVCEVLHSANIMPLIGLFYQAILSILSLSLLDYCRLVNEVFNIQGSTCANNRFYIIFNVIYRYSGLRQ